MGTHVEKTGHTICGYSIEEAYLIITNYKRIKDYPEYDDLIKRADLDEKIRTRDDLVKSLERIEAEIKSATKGKSDDF